MDESIINVNIYKKYCWAKKNQRTIQKTVLKSINYSLILAISIKKVIGYTIIKGGVLNNKIF